MVDTASGATAVGDPLDAIDDIVVAHRWSSADQLKKLRALLPAGADAERWLKLLGDERVVDADRRAQLDAVRQQQKVLPKFRLLKKLGAGGMGTVWLARLDGHDEPIALKVINARLAVDADFLGRFHRETKALQGIRHPHVAAVIDSGSNGGTHYLAMEYINGPNLGDMLKTHKALPESYVLRVIHQIAEGLAHVNTTAGLVHRDVKPENILVQRLTQGELFPEDDLAKLIDFGLVKNADDDEHLTQTGMTIGTPLYMSPEQVRGEKLDGRSDIYALGATMYHLLTGQAPFKGTSPGAIMSAHLTEPTPDPGDLVPSLDEATRRLVTMAMAKTVDERFRSFEALTKAIDEAETALHEKSGAGAVKLLRKPLVIAKKPAAKKPGTGAHRPAEHDPVNVTERIARKHGEAKKDSQRIAKVDVHGQPPAERAALTKPSERHAAVASDRVAKAPAPLPKVAAGKGEHSTSDEGVGDASAFRALTDRRASGSSANDPVIDPLRASASDETFNLRPVDAAPVTAPLMRTQPTGPSAAVRAGIAAAKRSAVYDEEAARPTGFGMLPWTILVFALCAAAAFAAVRFVL